MLITEKSFYALTPDGYHATGDIWMRMPSLGLLKQPFVSGLIVTPACDLANCKTETITYVPIIPISEFLLMPEFVADIVRQLVECLGNLGLRDRVDQKTLSYFDFNALIAELEVLTLDKSKLPMRSRCIAGCKLIGAARGKPISYELISALVSDLFGANWDKTKGRIVRNSYRSDLYYLPPDYQPSDWSAVPRHSVALLRYLITVPTYFLEEAHLSDERDWAGRRATLISRKLHWCEQCHEKLPPMRALRLREAFLSDLLTKLVGIYVRLGAPDLEETTLRKIEKEI